MIRRAHVAVAAAALFACFVLRAQDRQPAFGRVVDASGAPVAGAEVTLFWSPRGGELGAGNDRVVATADARGQFTVKLLPMRGYSAFARGAVQGDASVPMSPVRELVAAGARIELALTIAARARQVRLRGTGPWHFEAPLRLAAVVNAVNAFVVDAPFAAGTDGVAVVPPLPPLVGYLVSDRRGAPLWTTQVPMGSDGGGELELPAPQDLRVRVVDAQQQPIEAAEVRLQLGMLGGTGVLRQEVWAPWRVVGATGPDGTTSLRLPLAEHASEANFTLVAMADGRGASMGGHNNGWIIDGKIAALPSDGVLPFCLPPLRRFRLRHGSAPLTAPSAITGMMESRLGGGLAGKSVRTWWPFAERADAGEGGWIVPRLGAVAGDAVVHTEPFVLPGATATSVVLARLPVGDDAVLAVEQLRHLSVQVLDASGGPAAGIPLLLANAARGRDVARPVCCTDAAGRAELYVDRAACSVVAWVDDRMALQSFAADRVDDRCRLTLAPMPRMQLRVVDGKGQPIVGATFGGSSWRPGRGEADANLVALEQAFAQRLRSATASDAHGLLVLPLFVERQRSWEIGVQAAGHTMLMVDVGADETPREIVLR